MLLPYLLMALLIVKLLYYRRLASGVPVINIFYIVVDYTAISEQMLITVQTTV